MVVSQIPESLYPQRMINHFSSDASHQAASSQLTLRATSLCWSPSMFPMPHFKHLVYLPGKWHSAVRTRQCCSRMLWGLNNIWRNGISPHCHMACVIIAWPVCFSLSLVCWDLILNFCPAASLHFPSNTLSPSLLRHLTLICLKTAWLLLSQANNHFQELAQLFHLFAALDFFFLLHKQPEPAPVLGLQIWGQTSQHRAGASSSTLLNTCTLGNAPCACALQGSQVARHYLRRVPRMDGRALWVSVSFRFGEGAGVDSYFCPSFLDSDYKSNILKVIVNHIQVYKTKNWKVLYSPLILLNKGTNPTNSFFFSSLLHKMAVTYVIIGLSGFKITAFFSLIYKLVQQVCYNPGWFW